VLRLFPLFLGIFGLVILDPIVAAIDMWVFNYIFIAVVSIPLVIYVINRNKVLRFIFKGSTK